ncbi:winged helix-turn-helix domain-containing protein [Natronomonas salina]|uniref:winged helix-turn-helix domain-containing protein n=1 Tax=Natronomonas salina TaxID=1710540 RepID=UPI001FEC71D3|nr:winged helix-turn-helix domain-containing protein [Natronomonas salina]
MQFMTDDWNLIGFVIASRYRKLVIQELSDHPSTPSQITERTDATMASISHALSQLREKDCIELLVDEDRRKGRVYGLTDTGERVWKDLREQEYL